MVPRLGSSVWGSVGYHCCFRRMWYQDWAVLYGAQSATTAVLGECGTKTGQFCVGLSRLLLLF